MRRRLDLAAAVVKRPRELFLDEPTTGLDPRSRLGLWEVLEDVLRAGATIILTTQYLDEADRLPAHIAVIDHGRVIAEGTADELKDSIGGSVLVVRPSDAADAGPARAALGALGAVTDGTGGELHVQGGSLALLTEAARVLTNAEVEVTDLALRRPTLDDVFLSLTGHAAEAGEEGAA